MYKYTSELRADELGIDLFSPKSTKSTTKYFISSSSKSPVEQVLPAKTTRKRHQKHVGTKNSLYNVTTIH
jgi:hypothetical protein